MQARVASSSSAGCYSSYRTRLCALPRLPGRSKRRAFRAALFGNGNNWHVPTELLPASMEAQPEEASSSAPALPRTVYTIRMVTSMQRGAAMSEPMAGIHICLVSKDGRGVLHRVAPISDPEEQQAIMHSICAVAEPDVGANCEILSPSGPGPALPPPRSPAGPKRRFQEGSVDEVCLLAPDLGPLEAVMVATEGGSWVLDECDVWSSRTNHLDRFVCRRRLGGRAGEPAAYLVPVPPDAVVYGSGDAAMILTKEEAAAVQRMSMSSYSELKHRLLLATALLTAGGSGLAAVASGVDAAIPFALGGLAGLLYQFLLQVGTDAMVASAGAGLAGAGAGTGGGSVGGAAGPDMFGRLLSKPGVRVVLLTMGALLALWCIQDPSAVDGLGVDQRGVMPVLLQPPPTQAWQLGVAVLGFMMYKVAVLGVSLSPGGEVVQPAVHQYEKNKGL